MNTEYAQEPEFNAHRLDLFHVNGMPAEIFQDSDGYWHIPGGEEFERLDDAVDKAAPMFRAAGWISIG